jgi:hypothetical protein
MRPYIEAQLECSVMLVLCTVGWLQSPYCLGRVATHSRLVQLVSTRSTACV